MLATGTCPRRDGAVYALVIVRWATAWRSVGYLTLSATPTIAAKRRRTGTRAGCPRSSPSPLRGKLMWYNKGASPLR
ncbi:MAG: hypothetical protein LBQ66_08860 [Planctomycetaceae bacterium]|nr:hypothetical protein [Planctomycetaceae bacterium]